MVCQAGEPGLHLGARCKAADPIKSDVQYSLWAMWYEKLGRDTKTLKAPSATCVHNCHKHKAAYAHMLARARMIFQLAFLLTEQNIT